MRGGAAHPDDLRVVGGGRLVSAEEDDTIDCEESGAGARGGEPEQSCFMNDTCVYVTVGRG